MADDLRTFLYDCGTDGAPTAPGLYVLLVAGVRHAAATEALVAYVDSIDEDGVIDVDAGPWQSSLPARKFTRHAPLPPLAGRFERCTCRKGIRRYRHGVGTCERCGPYKHPLAAPGVRWVPSEAKP